MELRLKGFGIIEIAKAIQIDSGSILIEAADHFEKLAEITEYEIAEVYLTESEYGWGLVAFLKLPDNEWYDEDAIVFDIENPEIIQKLNARL